MRHLASEQKTIERRRQPPQDQANHDDFLWEEESPYRYERIAARLAEQPEPVFDDEEQLARRRTIRWKVPWRSVLCAGIILALLLVFRLFSAGGASPVYSSAPVESPAQAPVSVEATEPQSSVSATPSDTIFVHVTGAVYSPGLYELAAGSRVNEALTLAGGATEFADLTQLNLAAKLDDGVQVYVPAVGETAPPLVPSNNIAGTSAAASSSSKLVNLNTADLAELQTLPRVGPKLAQKIIDWRQANGGFSSVDELDAVPGIGPTMLENLKPLVTV